MLCADFETTVIDENKYLSFKDSEERNKWLDTQSVEVWLSCLCVIGEHEDKNNYIIGYSIEQFLEQVITYCNFNKPFEETIVWFHNLKFDGSYIVYYLLKNNIEFEAFIDDVGMWYSVKVETDMATIVFRDSLKVLNFSIDYIAKNLLEKHFKGETPLLKEKPLVVKNEWIDYIINDVRVMCYALDELYNGQGFTKFTSASETLKEYKETIDFDNNFPTFSYKLDSELRPCYKGGWAFVNPIYQNKPIKKKIKTYDENSKYPSILLNHDLPFGYPDVYEGKYIEPKSDEVAIYEVTLMCDLKEGYLPTFQPQSPEQAYNLGIRTTQYIRSTNGLDETFVLTNFDLDLIKKHYHHKILAVSKSYIFKAKKGMFDDHINPYKDLKEEASKNGDNFGKLKSKIMMNSLYGKFGAKTEKQNKIPVLENEKLKFELSPIEIEKPIYLPVAIFVTSIGRTSIITDAQNNYDIFLYCDTDSLHLIDDGREVDLDIDESRFGAWALENEAIYGKYIRAKLNIEESGSGKLTVTGAGMTPEVKSLVNKDNFNVGEIFKGVKKTTRQVRGGMAILRTDFKIKETDDLL